MMDMGRKHRRSFDDINRRKSMDMENFDTYEPRKKKRMIILARRWYSHNYFSVITNVFIVINTVVLIAGASFKCAVPGTTSLGTLRRLLNFS